MASESSARGPEWELYAAHRERFTQVVLSAAKSDAARLCVLGAGKCNDLDLGRLTQAFREVHLVDLEPALLASAISREPPEVKQRLVPHAPLDLSVLSPKRADKWRRRAPSAAELEALASSTRQGLLARLPGPFDVVVSACVLTQLGFALGKALGETSPLLGPLRLCVARTHLQTLVELTAPGGTSLLVSDLASSSHYPLTSLPPDADLTQILNDVVQRRAFYQLANPELLARLIAEAAPNSEATRLAPWLWNGPQARTYLVYGYRVPRHLAPA